MSSRGTSRTPLVVLTAALLGVGLWSVSGGPKRSLEPESRGRVGDRVPRGDRGRGPPDRRRVALELRHVVDARARPQEPDRPPYAGDARRSFQPLVGAAAH